MEVNKMDKNLKYNCEDCGFIWITLNGEHTICPKCHSKNIKFIEEIKDLDVDAILNHNKNDRRMLWFSQKGPLTCGKPAPDHQNPHATLTQMLWI